MDPLITLKIDGQDISVPAGTTVLEAARRLGIEIPTFCHHEKLIPIGACRMCLVEIEKMKGLQPACTTKVRDDMVVHTNTPEVIKTRQATLEFLLTNHPLDCPICDKAGECDLQDQAFQFGPGKSRYIEEKRHKAKARVLGPYLIMDQERCVLCRRCIRFMEEWSDDVQLGLFERGNKTYVDTFYGEPVDSIFSGNLTRVCPVGALTSRKFRFSARSWELRHTDSICLNCAVGCNISLHTKVNRLKRIVARENPDVNDEWLCDRGQFDHSFAEVATRVLTPLVRVDGRLTPATWSQALDMVAERLRDIVNRDGGRSIGVIGSARASNEANYLLQRLARACLHTNNVAMENPPPAGAHLLSTTKQLNGLGVTVLVGLDLEEEAPILELLGRHAALMNHTCFLVLYPQRTHLARLGEWLGCRAGTEATVLRGLAHLWLEQCAPANATDVESLKSTLAHFTPAYVEGVSGVPAETLQKAVTRLAHAPRRLLLYGNKSASDPDVIEALTVLASLVGCEKPAFIPAEANAIGAMDMGMSPNLLPGCRPLDDEHARRQLVQLWGCESLPQESGLSLEGMARGTKEGVLKAVYALGRPPTDLDEAHFVVVQASRLSDVPEKADVVLPACSFAETEGSYTNLCGRVQLARAALRPLGESRPDWWILSQLGARLGKAECWAFGSAGEVFAEIAQCVPEYAGLSYVLLGAEGKLSSRSRS